MYGYQEFIPLSEEEILKRVNQEEIVEMALGYKPVYYQKMLNPFRPRDKSAGAYWEWYNGRLWFIDFADNPTHRIAFKFISDFYNVSFIDALRIINTHFNLGLGTGVGLIAKPIIYNTVYEHQDKEKERAQIIYKPRPFAIRDKSSWFKYGINRDMLTEDQVLPALWYKLYSPRLNRWVVVRPKDNAYVFAEFKSRHVKILRPLANPNNKWISNCNEDDIFALDHLSAAGNICIIQKSYKDCRIIRNNGLSCIGFQNEGCIPSDEIIFDLISRFNSFPIFFDNDEAGIRAAQKISDHFNKFKPGIAYPLHLPIALNSQGITDPGDLVTKKSHAELRTFLIEKGLYGTSINHS